MLCAIKIIYDLGSRDVEKDALCVVVYAFLFTIIILAVKKPRKL